MLDRAPLLAAVGRGLGVVAAALAALVVAVVYLAWRSLPLPGFEVQAREHEGLAQTSGGSP